MRITAGLPTSRQRKVNLVKSNVGLDSEAK